MAKVKYYNVRDASGRFSSSNGTKKSKGKKPNKKEVKTIVSFYLLDDTGSMNHKKEATKEGFNKILKESREVDKKNGIISREYLALFGAYGSFRQKDQVVKLNHYDPHEWSTALWWATVESIKKLENLVTSKDKVVLTIFTDGQNNAAHEFQAVAKKLIEEKQKAGWVINFVGAGSEEEILAASSSISIYAGNTMSYVNTSAGVTNASNKMSSARGFYAETVSTNQDSNIGFFAEPSK